MIKKKNEKGNENEKLLNNKRKTNGEKLGKKYERKTIEIIELPDL